MPEKKEILGIITARGGSKSIPRKNIKSFLGSPLLVWTVEAGLKSGVLSRFILTTDDEEIASIGKKAGIEVPFMRPAELAQDKTPSLPVLQHAVSWLKEHEKYTPEYVVLLEPTSPGRRDFHIREAVEMLENTGADSVISLGRVPGHHNPYWQFKIHEDKTLELFTGGSIKDVIRRRQDLPLTYFRNGSIYAFKTELLFKPEPSLYGDDVRGYIMDEKYSVDIDSLEDWISAEICFKKIIEQEKYEK